MGKNLVGLVWLAGIVLAVLVYEAGPDRILYAGVHLVDTVREAIDSILAALAVDTYDVMRALTLGLLPAFLVLAALSFQRGRPAVWTVIVVAVLFLLLLYLPAREGWYVSSTRWTIAFFAVAVGCAVLTRRLTETARDWRGQPGTRPGGPDPTRAPPSGMPQAPTPPWSRPSR